MGCLVELLPCGLSIKEEEQLKLKTEQIKKYSKYIKIIGISIMLIYIVFGITALLLDPSSINYLWFKNIFADQLTEGNNYFVSISDSVGTSEILQ